MASVAWTDITLKPYLRQFSTWQDGHYSDTNGAESARRFYDSDDSTYYIDPLSTSNINALTLGGKIKIADGTQADKYVLTSNPIGVASWQPIPAGSDTKWDGGPTGLTVATARITL